MPFTSSLLDPFFKKPFSSKLQQMQYLIRNNEVVCLLFPLPKPPLAAKAEEFPWLTSQFQGNDKTKHFYLSSQVNDITSIKFLL